MACNAVKMPSPVAVRSANCSLSNAALVDVPVGRRLDQHRRGARIGDQPEVDARGQLAGELLGGRFGGGHPVGFDVGGPHGLGDVDDQHDDRAVARNPHIVGRPGHRDRQQHQRRDQQDGRQVTPPGGLLGCDAFQQLHVGEAQHPALPGHLDDDVQRHQPQNDQQEQEKPCVGEAGQRHRPEQRQCHSRPVRAGDDREQCDPGRAGAAPSFVRRAAVTGDPPLRRAGGIRRNGRCRRSSLGRCAATAAALRSCAACGPHRRDGPRPPWRSRRATARRW